MGQNAHTPATTQRLLDVKRGLGNGLVVEPQLCGQLDLTEPNPPDSAAGVVGCVNCGCIRQGHTVSRCPEYGLLFAA